MASQELPFEVIYGFLLVSDCQCALFGLLGEFTQLLLLPRHGFVQYFLGCSIYITFPIGYLLAYFIPLNCVCFVNCIYGFEVVIISSLLWIIDVHISGGKVY